MNLKRLALAGLAAVAVVALAAGPASADTAEHTSGSTAYWPVLGQGQTSEHVRTVQWLLNCKGVHVGTPAHFGPATYTAVKTYQYQHGLAADGHVGAYTWTDLASRSQVRYGDKNDCVKALQVALNPVRGWTGVGDLPITGYFGPKTLNALHKFQTTYGLPVTNQADVRTWNRLAGPPELGE